jgi:hypothetical protein
MNDPPESHLDEAHEPVTDRREPSDAERQRRTGRLAAFARMFYAIEGDLNTVRVCL